MTDFQFVASDADKCIFYRKNCSDLIILALFVDKGLLVDRDRKILDEIVIIFERKIFYKSQKRDAFAEWKLSEIEK